MRLTDLRVSRRHCEIKLEAGRLSVTDLGSVGGTLVRGQRVEKCVLNPDEVLLLGETEIRFVLTGVAQEKTLPPSKAVMGRPAILPADRLNELAGQMLAHYRVGEVLARGQSGIVFRAADLDKAGEPVALKVLWPQFSHHPQEMKRFVRSMRTVLPFRHPNLVTLHSAGKTGPFCWIAMEFIDGESLTKVIARSGVAGMLDWQYALRVAIHLARVLGFAHHRHVIHRNLTPQNVLIRKRDGQTMLGDLMFAKALEGALSQQVTRPGEVLGDVHFMSPERTNGNELVDERSDIYSLGAMVYALLTGRPPLVGNSLMETLVQIHKVDPVSPRKFQMSVPDQLAKIVLKTLAKSRQDRYQTAAELLDALDLLARHNRVDV